MLLPVEVFLDHQVSRVDVPHTLPRGCARCATNFIEYLPLWQAGSALFSLGRISQVPKVLAHRAGTVAAHPQSQGVCVRMNQIASQSSMQIQISPIATLSCEDFRAKKEVPGS